MTRITHQFIEACKTGDFQRMECFHRKMPDGYYPRDIFLQAMQVAIRHQNDDIFTYLIERHHTLLYVQEWAQFFMETIKNKKHALFWILDRYGEHYLRFLSNDSFWYEAMLNHDYLVLTHLFNKGYCNIRHSDVLETATLYSDLTLMQFLLGSPQLKDHATLTDACIDNIVTSGNTEVLRYVLEQGYTLTPDILTKNISTVEMFQFLWNHPHISDDSDKKKYLPGIFNNAVYNDYFTLLQYLLEEKEISVLFQPDLNTAMGVAVNHYNHHTVDYFLSQHHVDVYMNNNSLFYCTIHDFMKETDEGKKMIVHLIKHATSYVPHDHLYSLSNALEAKDVSGITILMKHALLYNSIDYVLHFPAFKQFCLEHGYVVLLDDIVALWEQQQNVSVTPEIELVL